MTSSQRVIPVEPLVVTTAQGMPPESLTLFQVNMGNRAAWFYPEAELWAHFMPAEPLEALLVFVEGIFEEHKAWGDDPHCGFCAAYRAYVEAKP